MKKILSVIAIAALFCLTCFASRAQDPANGEKTFKTKCAGCHGANGEGKTAMKSPSIKGKSADEISKAFATSTKHASVRKLSPGSVKDLAAYLATLK